MTTSTVSKRYFSVKEASLYTGIAVKTLYLHSRERKIPSIKYGRKLLFDVNDLDEYMQSLKRPAVNIQEKIDKMIEEVLDPK